ncbi:hypothetical protein XENTR_v10015074 [Xenopus tropicalis]|nr:hypothetical protein XENTR_v10015074 [Xenopus tropicalis]
MAQEENRTHHRSARIRAYRERQNSDYKILFLPQNIQQQRSPALGPTFLRSTENKIVVILFIAIGLICTAIWQKNNSQAFTDNQ